MMGLYVDGTSFPTRPNRHSSFLLLCLAVEACWELRWQYPRQDGILQRAVNVPEQNHTSRP